MALVRQSHPAFEVIVVDDCSADETPEFLRVFQAAHPELQLRTLRNETHAGANPSRNRGIRIARGEYVAFLDSDCLAAPDWLEKLMAGFRGPRVGAVTGLVEDQAPENLYELTFKGTHRLHQAGPAHRLVGGNMCVRRELLLKYRLDEDRARPTAPSEGRPDVTVSGRGDEEGLFLLLRAAGHEVWTVPDAVVRHEHAMGRRAFYRQALRGGRSAARLVYKFRLRQRIDMLPFLLAYVSLPLGLIGAWLLVVPAFFMCGALAAITYNDLFRKGKTVGETLKTFPLLVVYYHVRLAGYVFETVRLRVARGGPARVRLDEIPSDFPDTQTE